MSVSVETIRRWIVPDPPGVPLRQRDIRIKVEDLEAAPRQIPSARW